MAADYRMAIRSTRLSPFAFPSDTDFRFVLLIVVVIGASLLIYTTLYNDIPSNWNRLQATLAQCTDTATKMFPADSVEDITARTTAINRCMAPLYQERALTIAGWVILLLALAGVIYLIFPRWKIYRNKLVPLAEDDAPEMVAYLADLCRLVELTTPPQFLLKPLGKASSGHAFGRRGRYYVVLNGGLVTRFYKDRSAFRAIMLHELAHLRNEDVDKTYFSLAVGLAFLLVALLPFVFVRVAFVLSEVPLIDTFNLGWRILVLTVFVYLSILAILRSREVYADVRASVWDGPTGGLSRILHDMPRSRGGRGTQLLHLHPDPEDRLRLLHETYRLFPLGFWEAFVTGVATSATWDALDNIINALLPGIDAFLLELAVCLPFGILIIGIIGVGIWRATFAGMIGGQPFQGIGRLGIGLGVGFLLGQFLSLAAYAYLKSGEVLTGLDALIFYALWIPIVMLGFWAFLYWIAACASTWLEVAAGSHSPRFTYRLGLPLIGLWLAAWLAVLIYYIYPSFTAGKIISFSSILDYVAQPGNTSIPQSIIVLFMTLLEGVSQNPFILLALACLWAFPLSAWLRRKKIGLPFRSSWAFLDPSNQPLVMPLQPPLRPGLALVIGTIGGFLASLLLLLLSLLVCSIRPGDESIVWLLRWQPVVAALMQVVIAVVVTCWVKRLGSLHGLLAAFMAGCILSIGAIVNFFLYFSLRGVNFLAIFQPFAPLAWGMFSKVVNEGALLSLPAVLVVSFFAVRLREKVIHP